MGEMEYWKSQHLSGKISRRELVGRSAALGAGATLIAEMLADVEARADEAPKQGGTLKVGIGGGSTTDSLDPRTITDSFPLFTGFALYSALAEVGPENQLIPELAESIEAKPGASEWILNLRKGVTFTNGKTFDADDAIYSLNLHRGGTKSGAAGSMKPVSDIKKLGPNQIQISLSSPDADFSYVLSDYHLLMVPNGFNDWANPVGTGAFKLDKFEPGVRVSLLKHPNYWKKDRGHLDRVEATIINDASARINALISGQVDAINRVDPKAVALLKKSSSLQLVQAAGGYHTIMTMMIDRAPYDNPDIRQALKYAIDREQVLKAMFSGYGVVGNDQPIPRSDPFFNSELPQTKYDPDKARFHFKKAGLSDPNIVLQASDAAFGGAVDMATLFQSSAAKADIKIDVKKEPADGFYDNVWLKGSFVTSYWGGRPAATQMFGVAYKSDAPWNETHWRRPDFDKLLADARSELDENKRKNYIWAMQEMVHNDGGSLIPAFRDWLDAHGNKVGGYTPHVGFDLDNGRLAEKAWIKS